MAIGTRIAADTGAGLVVISSYEPGAAPGEYTSIFHTLATATFNPNLVTHDFMGADGTTIARRPVGINPTLTLEFTEAYPQIEARRLGGRVTSNAATTAAAVRVQEGYQTGDSLIAKSAAQTVLDGLTLASGVRPGYYQVDITVAAGPATTAIVRRLSPSPAVLNPVELFSDWVSGTPDSLVSSPNIGDTGFFLVQVVDAIVESVDIDFSNPTIYYHHIMWANGQDGGNVSSWGVADPCVASGEDPLVFERAAAASRTHTYTVLGGNANVKLDQFADPIPVAGL